MGTHVSTVTRTHAVTFMTDKLRNVLRDIIRENGLDPDALMGSWEIIGRGLRTWLSSGHLRKLVIEFYEPASGALTARWDIPVAYTGLGDVDDMWIDRDYLRQIVAKAKRPTASSYYQVVFDAPGAPDVAGFVSCTYRNTGALVSRDAGTAVGTGYMSANLSYWR